MNKKFINPYDFLGISINSTIKELKKKYFELALICHPDKGGSKDDMIFLNKSYKYIYRQLEGINTKVTYEDLEESFMKFCKEQEDIPCEFSEIYDNFRKTFNENFDKINLDNKDPNLDGYGKYMLESNLDTTDYSEIKKKDEGKNIEIPKFEIIEYSSPQSFEKSIFSNIKIKKIKDFSIENGTDYMKAFTTKLSDNCTDYTKERSLEDIINERDNFDNNHQL